jgi:PhnB protein
LNLTLLHPALQAIDIIGVVNPPRFTIDVLGKTLDFVCAAGVFTPYAHELFSHPTVRARSNFLEVPMSNVRPIPEGYHSITPQLTCRDAARAIDFYKEALGAKELMRLAGPSGRVMHAELQIGDSRLMLADEFPGMSVAPTPSAVHSYSLFVYTDDVDTTFNRAVKAGARADMPPSNMFWGDRYGKFTDPFGHQWGVATHVEDVAPDEMERRSEEWTKQMAKAAGQSN